MKVFVLWPIFFGFYGKNVSRIFQNRTPGIRMMNCRKSIYNFIKIVFLNVTGNLSSSFLFIWQNLFSRFLAIVSFVSGGTVWDYDFFYWKYKSCWYTFGRWATTFLDMSRFLPPGFSWVYSSCTEEPFHGKDFLSKKKQNISSPPEVERKRFFKNLAEVFHECCHCLVLRVQTKLLWTFFWTKNIDTLWPLSKFSRIFGINLSQPFSEQNSTGRAEELEESFFVSLKIFFLRFPGNWAKVSRLLGDIFSEIFWKVHLTCPEQLFEVKKFVPES